MRPELVWSGASPRSLRFDDIYFASLEGLAESRAVYLEGCGLPQAWARRDQFTVAELGFGTGLNIAALLHLWRRTRPEGARLSIFSVEAYPLSVEEAARALGGWPELAESSTALLTHWPKPRAGFHRLALQDDAVTLDLYVGEVGEALSRWSGKADAWFLDGFAPSRNPEMWRQEVLAAVARLSAPGARLASFTVAGHVRRGLAAVGFDVAKRPGFGAKSERLEAWLPQTRSTCASHRRAPRRVAIVGAGVAGASLARAFARQGVACAVIEAADTGAGASGNPSALVTPRLEVGFGPAAGLHAQAFAYAVDAYRREAGAAIIAESALQLGASEAAGERFRRLAAWDGFRPGGLQVLDDSAAAKRLDERVDTGSTALLIADALVLEPAVLLRTWLSHADRIVGRVKTFQASNDGWRCLGVDDELLAETDIVCLTAGFNSAALLPQAGLQPVRGQVEFTEGLGVTVQAAAWGAYAIPLRGGDVLCGASHLRGDADDGLRISERGANLAALSVRRPALAEQVLALAPQSLRSRAAVRAATRDHLPLAGAWGDGGLYVLSGLGGRGFTLAPLLAEHIAADVLGAPSPIAVDHIRRLRADRFSN